MVHKTYYHGIGVDRRTVLKGAVAIGGMTLAGTAAAKPGGGPPGAKGCDVVVPDDGSTIQDGVNTADSGDTVCVKATGGPYQEQIVINKDLTLRGVNNPTIEAPSSPDQFTIPESDDTWEPVVFAFGGSKRGGDVTGSGTVDVDITGFTVDGADRNPSGPRIPGIFLRNVNGELSGNTVDNLGINGPETFGVAIYGDSNSKVRNNDVKIHGRVGIFANGDRGPAPDPDVSIRNNTVIGPDGQSNWAPNGIQVSAGATGKVVDNTVEDNWGPALGSGIIIVDSDGISVKGNSLDQNEVGLFFGKFFTDDPVGNATIQANELVGGPEGNGKMDYGTYLYDSTNSKVVNNSYDTWETGVFVFSGENNKVVRNSFTDVDDEVVNLGDDTKNPPNPANP